MRPGFLKKWVLGHVNYIEIKLTFEVHRFRF